MFTLPREITNAILACIRATLTRCLHELRDENEEVWLSKEEFLKQFGMFTPSWLKEYGETLPCVFAKVIDENGIEHKSRVSFPRNKIQAMIRDGRIKHLKVKYGGETASRTGMTAM